MKRIQKFKQNIISDKRSRALSELQPGDLIFMRKQSTCMWNKKRLLLEQPYPGSSVIQTANGNLLQQNHCDVKPIWEFPRGPK